MSNHAASILWTFVLVGLANSAEPGKKPPGSEKTKRNLIPNGDFEEGKITPKGWQTIDGLTTFWVKDKDPKRGKVIKFDTDILQSQGYAWWVNIAKGVSPLKAPKKLPTKAPKFDTLAGLDGVWYWSDFVPIRKGKSYWLTLDVKGGGIKVWLVGYPKKSSTAFGADAAAFQEYLKAKLTGKPPPNKRGRKPFIYKYDWRGQLSAGGSNQWRTYSRRKLPFRPTKYTPQVRYVRVLILPFWPPGEYYVDNVKLVEFEDKGG